MFFGNPPIKSNELYPITSCRGSSIRNMPEKYHKLRGHIYCFVWAITASCKRQQASFGDAMLELRNNISSSLLQERNSRLFEWNPNGIYEIIYIQYTCIIMYHVICIHNFHRSVNLHLEPTGAPVSRERFFSGDNQVQFWICNRCLWTPLWTTLGWWWTCFDLWLWLNWPSFSELLPSWDFFWA